MLIAAGTALKRFHNLLEGGQTQFNRAISTIADKDLREKLSDAFAGLLNRLHVIDAKWTQEDQEARAVSKSDKFPNGGIVDPTRALPSDLEICAGY